MAVPGGQRGKRGYREGVAWDDDDWTGEPPEGRHTRDRAKPGFWANQWQAAVAYGVLGVLVLVAILVILLR